MSTSNLITEIARRTAAHPDMESAVLGAVRSALPIVLEAVIREMYPGETLSLYVPKAPRQVTEARRQERAARDQRIAASIAAGEALDNIAERERVSKRHARRVRARFGGHRTP